jgi:hypothetical protein
MSVSGLSAQSLFSLACGDARLKVNSGQYLYLGEWGGPRRESMSEAVAAVLTPSAPPLALEDILLQVEKRMRRICDRRSLINCLRALEIDMDPSTEKWSFNSEVLPVEGCQRNIETFHSDLPVRQFPDTPVQPHSQKYFAGAVGQIKTRTPAVPARKRGVRTSRTLGRDAMDAMVPLTNGACCGRQSRVVLAPRRWRQVRGSHSADDGGKKARSPGRARYKP